MRGIWIISILFILFTKLGAQQDVLFTQFAYDKLGFNPGYAGAHEHISLNAIYRNQWLGLEGSPVRFSASLNFPSLDQKLGLGLHIDKSDIAIFGRNSIQGIYSYRIPMGSGSLAFGLNTSIRQFKADWSDPKLRPPNGWANDPAVDPNLYTKMIFNLGAGLYFRQEGFYAGVSVPRISKADIDFDDNNLDTLVAVESRLIYLMGGGRFDVNSNLELSPQLLLTIPEVGIMQYELSIIGILANKFHIGANYSSGGSSESPVESIDLILGLQASNQMFFGLSYDITMSELREVSNGTIELIANYRFNKKNKANIIINPRYY